MVRSKWPGSVEEIGVDGMGFFTLTVKVFSMLELALMLSAGQLISLFESLVAPLRFTIAA
jgi:hypothetical protein